MKDVFAPNKRKNVARRGEKHCPVFCETLPMVFQNIAERFFMRCRTFGKTMGICFLGNKFPFDF